MTNHSFFFLSLSFLRDMTKVNSRRRIPESGFASSAQSTSCLRLCFSATFGPVVMWGINQLLCFLWMARFGDLSFVRCMVWWLWFSSSQFLVVVSLLLRQGRLKLCWKCMRAGRVLMPVIARIQFALCVGYSMAMPIKQGLVFCR